MSMPTSDMPTIISNGELSRLTALYLKFFYEPPHSWLWDSTLELINNLSVSQCEDSWQGTDLTKL